MGAFDFPEYQEDKKKNVSVENEQSEAYLGDLIKTNIVYELVKTPPEERDLNWQKTFLENIAQARFQCGDPQVITGPDGFPYFQLFLPEKNTDFQCFVIEKMKDDFLLSEGLGVVINPSGESVDWVLSYGEIVNLHLNHTFYTLTETPFSNPSFDEIISKNEEVMAGEPSEEILPQQTRKIIAELLKINGIEEPKVLLIMRQKGNEVAQDLVFNITPENFENEEVYSDIMETISWYLPQHYSFIGMDEKDLGAEFIPL